MGQFRPERSNAGEVLPLVGSYERERPTIAVFHGSKDGEVEDQLIEGSQADQHFGWEQTGSNSSGFRLIPGYLRPRWERSALQGQKRFSTGSSRVAGRYTAVRSAERPGFSW